MAQAKVVEMPDLGAVTIVRGDRPGLLVASGSRIKKWRTPWEVEFHVVDAQVGILRWTYNLGDEQDDAYRTVLRGLRGALKR